ncbi:O-antigen ligase [Desulfonatronum thiosulfatophilum]|uniref:O-antigen ligase n=1 Tax=Desulfonatronum thiosulfatophilum TaxID=617002 RepID=A0A1G6EL87_9BACT|nr:O-antigen ligase family protein [Desulfonatronum thiosulfatophilum]SDB58062.1 O-antigen ligase [Desulfonatronum thiosulfatophilum]
MNVSTQNNMLLYGIMLLVLVYVARIQELFQFLIPLQLGKIAILLALTLLMVSPKPPMRASLLKIPQVKMVLGILALCLISVPFSVYQGQSFNHAVMGFPRTILFFFLLIYAVNNFHDLRKLFWAFIFGVMILAYFMITASGTGRLAASATYDPNDIAMLFVITLPIVYFFMNSRKGPTKLVLMGILLALLFAFILTGSRGGFIGLMVITIFILFMDKYRTWLTKILVLGIAVLAFFQFAPETYWERIRTITTYEEDYNYSAEYGRKALWKRGMQMMMQNPLTGVGAAAFTTGLGLSYGEEGGKWLTAHNAFVQIGAELGIGGFVLFIWLIASSIRYLRRLRAKYARQPGIFRDHLWMATALEVSLWGYVATAMFLSAAYFVMFYFLIAMCCILRKLEMQVELQEQAQENHSGLETQLQIVGARG